MPTGHCSTDVRSPLRDSLHERRSREAGILQNPTSRAFASPPGRRRNQRISRAHAAGGMKPPAFAYFEPRTLDETLAVLGEHADDAKVLAGGQSLVPMLNLRLSRPGFSSISNRVSSLAYIESRNGGLEIGAMTRAALDRAVRSRGGRLSAAQIIAIQFVAIFRFATVAPSRLARARRSSRRELPAVVTALGAELVVRARAENARCSATLLYRFPSKLPSRRTSYWLQFAFRASRCGPVRRSPR
jgi:hypothetical protein